MYQALYRVWRPQTFDDMVGQEVIATTLKNAVISGKISHAYLFSGPRGTGKTSAAKIFAKAINCTQSADGQPCNQCALCVSATNGMLSDIIEIDAASNNGVDEIRDIRDKSRYAPTQAKYKVYIIDEVHMLSIGAFNALLKTLEEPTQNVIFILATTEPHKIPATILSRVQRYDFKRIAQQDIEQRLTHILDTQQVQYEQQAVSLIARMANGGMRDALSLLDQVLSYANDNVTLDVASAVTGAISDEQLSHYVLHVGTSKAIEAMAHLHDLLVDGKTANRFIEELLVFVKEVLLDRLDGTVNRFEKLAPIETHYLYDMIDVLSQTQQQLKQNVQQDLYVEVMTMKLVQLHKQPNPTLDTSGANSMVETLLSRIEQLENKVRLLESAGVSKEQSTAIKQMTPPTKGTVDFEVNLPRVYSILSQATRQDKETITAEWSDILSCLTVQQRAKLNASNVLAASPTGVIIGFEYDLLCAMTASDTTLKQEISGHAMRLIQHPCQIECVPMAQWQTIRTQFVNARQSGTLETVVTPSSAIEAGEEEIFEQAQVVDEVVQQATELFGNIVEIMEEK